MILNFNWFLILSRLLTLVILGNLQGCFSPKALDYSVIAYDKASSDVLSKLLLLNIARAHQHQPVHFTGVSNIAATFNYQLNAGLTTATTGEIGSLLTPQFGGTVSDNPTISIVPIEGEEFTRRLLTPFPESKLTMLLRQGIDVDLLLRLLAGELRMSRDGHTFVFLNKPNDEDGYRLFRQVVLHLSAIQDKNKLFVEPLIFEQHWVLPADSIAADQLYGLQKEYKVELQPKYKQIKLSKQVIGHILLTNYDPSILSNEERIRLNEEASQGAANDVSVDIRAGHTGGEWPIHGVFRLRSFLNVLNFIGKSIEEQPEYAVEKNPITPAVKQNPVQTMALLVSQDSPSDINVQLGELNYSLQPETGYQWNREAFRLLSQVFQMTMTELAQQGAPGITINK